MVYALIDADRIVMSVSTNCLRVVCSLRVSVQTGSLRLDYLADRQCATTNYRSPVVECLHDATCYLRI